MKIYNSLTRTKEEFVPMEEGKVKMYACGITVYDDCHIGHARQAITYDMISQYLRYRGYDVTYVRNYTDVDDKIIARANEQGINPLDYSQQKIVEAEEDLDRLNVIDADIKPKASENIDNIIDFTSKLIEKGHAYVSDRGDVYFSVKSFPGYGKLSNRNPDELISGVRKDVEEGKEDPRDFALWKAAKEGEISWESPWGQGRPGWHIECSTMILHNLGETIDIHGGGKDLIFPHHENEIAQSEALTGKPFVRCWTHNGLIKVNGQKMSKSLGNSLTIKQALEKYDPEVIRYAMLSKHYSSDLDLNEREFALSENQLYYFYNTLNNIDMFLAQNEVSDSEVQIEGNISDKIESNFVEAMDDDFNSSAAIAQLYPISKFANGLVKDKKYPAGTRAKILNEIKNKIKSTYSILGIMQEEPVQFINEMKQKHLQRLNLSIEQVEEMIQERTKAKAERNYAVADELRRNLDEMGIILNDSKDGTTWDLKELYNLSVEQPTDVSKKNDTTDSRETR
ncbi:MAG: cysteine--tRNA ligase [Clostridia bacterium]|nr:cysteine--tRNA ligase [Clostridia bacterium]